MFLLSRIAIVGNTVGSYEHTARDKTCAWCSERPYGPYGACPGRAERELGRWCGFVACDDTNGCLWAGPQLRPFDPPGASRRAHS